MKCKTAKKPQPPPEIERPTAQELSDWAHRALQDQHRQRISWTSTTVVRMLKEIGILKREARVKRERKIIVPGED